MSACLLYCFKCIYFKTFQYSTKQTKKKTQNMWPKYCKEQNNKILSGPHYSAGRSKWEDSKIVLQCTCLTILFWISLAIIILSPFSNFKIYSFRHWFFHWIVWVQKYILMLVIPCDKTRRYNRKGHNFSLASSDHS